MLATRIHNVCLTTCLLFYPIQLEDFNLPILLTSKPLPPIFETRFIQWLVHMLPSSFAILLYHFWTFLRSILWSCQSTVTLRLHRFKHITGIHSDDESRSNDHLQSKRTWVQFQPSLDKTSLKKVREKVRTC